MCPAGFEGVADGRDVGLFQGAEDGAEDGGEEVGVFVGVGVGEVEAGGLEAADLGGGFAGDFAGVHLAAEGGEGEVGEGGAEELLVGAEEGGDGGGVGGGGSVGEDDVTADAEVGVAVGNGDGIGEGGAGGHEGGGGEDAGLVELFDGAVDAVGQAEVVGVDDELRGHGLRIRGWMREQQRQTQVAAASLGNVTVQDMPWREPMPRREQRHKQVPLRG